MRNTGGRIIAIDHGLKRVGIALSDPLHLFAQPLGAYPPDEVPAVLGRIHERDGIETLVVGWPLDVHGNEGEATRRVSAFIRRLTRAFPDVPVVKWDERFTSEMAREAIRGAGARMKARRNKERVDAAAAAIILQEYLDEQTSRA